MQKLADKALAELRKDPLHPEKAADAGTTLIRTVSRQNGDPIPEIGVSKELNDAVAPLRKGEMTSGPIVLPENKVAIASVTDYQPPHQAKLEDAKEMCTTRRPEETAEHSEQEGLELVAKAPTEGGDLTKAAKEMGVEIKTSRDVNRHGAIESVGSASFLEDAYTKPVGPD